MRTRNYYDSDMSNDEYAYRQRTEEESHNQYANNKKIETRPKDEDSSSYGFDDDESSY